MDDVSKKQIIDMYKCLRQKGLIPEKPSAPTKVNCLRCEHFYVTWNPKFPRACRIFGFKGRSIPSIQVKRITGVACCAFKENCKK